MTAKSPCNPVNNSIDRRLEYVENISHGPRPTGNSQLQKRSAINSCNTGGSEWLRYVIWSRSAQIRFKLNAPHERRRSTLVLHVRSHDAERRFLLVNAINVHDDSKQR
ncbi:hypothetical protein E1301_Tti013657 [Triplophysa tibetana]|uniref:Uncharacterized protein n=1 Tax=Triplophysa tibetana TaxID=1572043 RepID=A0A5A9PMA0_9TELE|nr:hypothetical protein E1301_Tti013657 [Triplophysa tibetana]